MRYRIPENVYKKIENLVSDIKFEFDGSHFISYDVKTFEQFKKQLDRLAVVNNEVEFKTWFNKFLEHPFKLYKLMGQSTGDKYKAPKSIDFKTQLDDKLQKKLLPKVKGMPTSVEYYEKKMGLLDSVGNPVINFLGQPVYEYENLIARIDFGFEFDSFGFINRKTAILKWYREDGKLSEESKDLGKVFDTINDHEARISEGELRRKSIIQGLQLPVMNMLREIYDQKTPLEILSIGRSFLDSNDEAFRDFIDKSLSVMDVNHSDYGKRVAWVTIRDYDNDWLDVELSSGGTARQFIMDELDN